MNRLNDDSKVALWYLNEIKRTLGSGSKEFKSFYTLFGKFGDGTLSVPDLISSVKELLSGHDDLLHGFTFFLPKNYPITSFKASADPKEYTTTVINGNESVVGSPKRQKFGDHVPKEYTTTINGDEYDVCSQERQKLGDHVPKEYTTTVNGDKYDVGSRKRQKFSDDVMSQIQQATELANKVRERFNEDDGVYKSFLDALCGYKTEEKIDEVEKKMMLLLRDQPDLLIMLSRFSQDLYEKSPWESIKKGKRDESYDQKVREKAAGGSPIADKYKKMMIKCEDQHYEADITFHRFKSTIEKMKLFIQDAEAAGGTPTTDLNEYFTPINLRCIKQLYYKDQKGAMIDQLGKNSVKSGKIVLNRLNQKLDQVKDYLSEYKKVWAKVYKDCHEKIEKKETE